MVSFTASMFKNTWRDSHSEPESLMNYRSTEGNFMNIYFISYYIINNLLKGKVKTKLIYFYKDR